MGLLALVSCAKQPELSSGVDASSPVDFSGSWELDYGRSDNIGVKLNALHRQIVRELERRQRMGQRGSDYSAGSLVIGGAGQNSGPSLYGLAQMADFITQSQLLEIRQDHNDIEVKREGNFALTCEFFGSGPQVVETPMGSEVCGWLQHQLEFRIVLPEGLAIRHRLSLGPRGQLLNIATTVISDEVSQPFTVNRVYRRFDPEADGIRCEMTLTRGKVCTTEAR
jgi:hypothetical protein